MSVEPKHLMPPLQAFAEVAPDSIREGMISDRDLFVFLQKNNKYVRVLKKLFPVDARIHKIVKQSNVLYTKDHSIDTLCPQLSIVAKNLFEVCNNQTLPSYEKQKVLLTILKPIVNIIFTDSSGLDWDPTNTNSLLKIEQPEIAIFLMQYALQSPKPNSLLFLENISVGIYEICLTRASIAGIFAIIIGYHDIEFIQQYVQAVFLEELKLIRNEYVQKNNKIPDYDPRDKRFGFILQDDLLPYPSGVFNDDCIDLIHFVRWLYKSNYILSSKKELVLESIIMTGDEAPSSRVINKLQTILSSLLKDSFQKSDKAAA